MKNRKFRLGMSVMAFASMGLAWACSSATNNGPSTSTGNNSSGGGNNSNSTAGGSSGAAASGGDICSASQAALSGVTFGPTIDDMNNQQSETGGSWYTYSDRTVANSEPPQMLTPAAPGTLTPTEGASFPPNTCASGTLTLGGTAVGYREASGGGENNWGAGFGMDMVSDPPDGGPVAFNTCSDGGPPIFDTSPTAMSVGIPQPFNASAYSGFAFWGISLTGANVKVNVQVDDGQTSPWGGACNVCLNGGKCPAKGDGGATATVGCPCSDNFIETVTFLPNKWTQFQIKWTDASLKVSDWSTEGALTFDPTTMYNIHFQLTTSSGKALPNFDVAVAYIQWTM